MKTVSFFDQVIIVLTYGNNPRYNDTESRKLNRKMTSCISLITVE